MDDVEEAVDYSNLKGCADEAHFNDFVPTANGELVAPLINKEGVKNADYLFRQSEIIGEHKILETDFAQTPETLAKVDGAFAKFPDADFTNDRDPLFRELFSILRVPICRIIKKANKQIKETKLLLKLTNHRGIVFLVNDEFRSAPPSIVIGIIRSILQEKERYRSVDGVVYLTNHYVEVSENDLANLLWVPIYKGYPSDALVNFVDDLGSRWSSYMEATIGPFDGSFKGNSVNWDHAHVVQGPRRQERFEGSIQPLNASPLAGEGGSRIAAEG
jgi:hypothetical protein